MASGAISKVAANSRPFDGSSLEDIGPVVVVVVAGAILLFSTRPKTCNACSLSRAAHANRTRIMQECMRACVRVCVCARANATGRFFTQLAHTSSRWLLLVDKRIGTYFRCLF